MTIEVAFVRSVASPADFSGEPLPEVALVGRSNVGKSSLINALVRRRVARTSAAPGKTRLANVYRVARGGRGPLYLVDLPGYGYARGGKASARAFDALTTAYFERAARHERGIGALLLVDSRHPGLAPDAAAWAWLRGAVMRAAVVATKIDKLTRGERSRTLRAFESVFHETVLPVSAATGEGLDELWKLIDRLANSSSPNRAQPAARETAPPPNEPRRSSGSISRRSRT